MLGFFQDKEIDQIYAYEFLQKFGMGLIGIFIPIYIFSETGSVEWTFLYLIGYSMIFLLVSVPVSYIISRIGFKHSLIASYIFYLPAFITLRVFTLSTKLIAGVSLLVGLAKAFHWISLHSEFAVDSDSDGRGGATGKMLGLPRLARSIAPLLGGAVLAWYGFPVLVSITILVFMLSSLPLLASKDHRDPLDYGFRDFLNRKHLKLGSMFVFRGMTITPSVFLFPLFIYIIAGSIDAGGVSSLKGIGSMLFALVLGKASDSLERKHLIIIGLLASAVLFFARAFVTESIQAFAISIAAGLMFMVYYIPLYSDLADMAEDEDILEFYAFREFTLGIGKVLVLLPALYFALNSSLLTGLKISFGIAGLACFLLLGYTRIVDL